MSAAPDPDLNALRLEDRVLDLEIAVEAARTDLLAKCGALLMARRHLARYLQPRQLVDGR